MNNVYHIRTGKAVAANAVYDSPFFNLSNLLFRSPSTSIKEQYSEYSDPTTNFFVGQNDDNTTGWC